MLPLLLRGARLWRHGPADVLLRDGCIESIAPALAAPPEADVIDARGGLLLPGLVDGHAHLDKTLWGTPWHAHRAGPTLLDRIDNERRVLRELGLSPQQQSLGLARHMVTLGTTHVRSHVDVAPDIGLRHLHGVMAMRETLRDLIDVQLVAFPQCGVMRQPGTLDLLDQAVREGAEVIGGLDPQGIDGDAAGQLNGIFAIAARHGCGIDIHLHERGEQGAGSIAMICERAGALGLAGRVAISHAFCLGQLDDERLACVLDQLARHDIAVMTHAPGGYTPFPPIRKLAERGIRLFSGSDGVRDTWTPMNTPDMLQRAWLLAYNSGYRDDADLERVLGMCTYGGAQLVGAQGYGLRAGDRADLVLIEAENGAEAVAMHPRRQCVIKHGKVVARNGRLVEALH